jgi:hypothetical protein
MYHSDMEYNVRSLLTGVCLVCLMGHNAYGQSYAMSVHLRTGQTVTIPLDQIRKMVFTEPNRVPEPAAVADGQPAFRVLQNYPNPFNPSTTIVYDIARTSEVSVRIFDLRGALIRDLLHERQGAGRHQVSWDGADNTFARVSSGVYFSVVQSGDQLLSRRLILVK